MPGRMGGVQRTVKNVWVYQIDPARNLLYLKGQVTRSFLTLQHILLKHRSSDMCCAILFISCYPFYRFLALKVALFSLRILYSRNLTRLCYGSLHISRKKVSQKSWSPWLLILVTLTRSWWRIKNSGQTWRTPFVFCELVELVYSTRLLNFVWIC